MTAWRENDYSTVTLGQPPFGRAASAGVAREITAPSPGTRTIAEPRMIIIEPQPHHYAEMARRILRRTKRTVGVVLSVAEVVPADAKPMIDTRIVHGRFRPRLANPPAHVVLPAEVREIAWGRMTFRYVWILSNERSAFPAGGILFLPPEDGAVFFMVTFNVGALDDGRCTNVHHGEMQAVRWINEQPPPWRARVGGLGVWNLSRSRGLGYSPCNACCSDLARFLTHLRALHPRALAMKIRATLTWLTLYDKNKACGHPTDTANLRRLAASGWELNGPGWPPGRPAVPCPSRGRHQEAVRRGLGRAVPLADDRPASTSARPRPTGSSRSPPRSVNVSSAAVGPIAGSCCLSDPAVPENLHHHPGVNGG